MKDLTPKPQQLDLALKRELVAQGAAREEPPPQGVLEDFDLSAQGAVHRDLMDCTNPWFNPAAAKGIRERAEWGREKYGTYLQPFNGRFGIRDAMAEAADLVVYLKQMVMEGDQFAAILYPTALNMYTSLYGRSKR